MIKDMVKSTMLSVGIAFMIFCLAGIAYDVAYKGNFTFEDYHFTKMVIGCVVVGLGFGVPSVVYSKEDLPMLIKVIIHMGIGCIVYTATAYAVGWIGEGKTFAQGLMVIAIQLAVAFLIWFFFMLHFRKEAKEMNERIQQMK